MFNDQRMYRPDEVAALWDVSVRTIYRLIDNGDLAAVKVGGSLRISGLVLNTYLDKNTCDPLGLKDA